MQCCAKILSLPPTFPRKSVILLVFIKVTLLGSLIFYARDSYREITVNRKCLRLSELNGIIDNLDEVLSMAAQMAAATGDKSWEDRYRNFEPKLNSTIKEALEVGKELGMKRAVAKTEEANIKLTSMENRAFDLIHEGKGQEASALLNSREYKDEKDIYRIGMERIAAQINDFVDMRDSEHYFKNCMLVVFVLLAVPTFIIALIVILVMIKRYESHLNKCERRFVDMSEITNAWIWDSDSKMRFTYANHVVKDILGYEPEEIIGKTLAELMAPSKFASFLPVLNDVMINPKPFLDPERELLHKDGTSRTIRVNGIPLYNHNDEFEGYRGICICHENVSKE